MINLVYYSPELRVHRDGSVERYYKTKKEWNKLINNDNSHGYNRIEIIRHKKVERHRLIGFCFLGLKSINFEGDFTNDEMIDHIDNNKLNNSVNNLQIVNNAENQWKAIRNENRVGDNRLLTKKYRVKIQKNRKIIDLGYFKTKEEADQAYLIAKAKYHIIAS